ncbi:MAG: sensor histidine kinase [Fimbriimonas sp.]
MGRRSTAWITWVALGSAAVFLILAGLVAAGVARLNPAWLLVSSASILALLGIKARSTLTEQLEMLVERGSQNELLQRQLEEQRNAIDSLADGLDVALFITDSRGQVLYANRTARQLFAFDQPIGRSLLAVTLSYDLEQLVIEAFRLNQTLGAELSFTYPEERIALAKAWPPGEGGTRVFLSLIEITDLRRLERIRRDFVANVSHELRTPMTVIRAMAETLQDELDPDDALFVRYLAKIIDEVDRLSAMTQDLLVLSAAESNPVRKLACNLADVFASVVQQLNPKAREKDLTLTYRGPKDCIIEANPAQMTQVALNLVDNAINYTADGTITVELTRHETEVEVSVTDTGIGIPVDQQTRIFERFYRADRARSRATGGTGLGLSIVKHIVEAHGGHVSVKSSLNKGSTFTVSLPVGDLVDGPRSTS